ncbi:macro domain-containing protein [Dactylosporangium sp. McL0621]|uniref:macro domain-containing protein n=1 Tax=Dactylosporangium sp. McL0621 TaxID=3415678 RepID=UPI003CF4D6AF
MRTTEPLHATIVAFDVERSGGRDDHLILRMRSDLRDMVAEVLRRQSIDPGIIDITDLGDGLRLVVPAQVPPSELLDPFIANLAANLRRHRRTAAPSARLRLRVAVHMGLLHRDDGGWAGLALVHCARLLDSAVLRRHLEAAHRADLAVILSCDVFEQVVGPGYGLDPDACGQVLVMEKETSVPAWIHVPGYPHPSTVPVVEEPVPAAPDAAPAPIVAVRPASGGRWRRAAPRFWSAAVVAAGSVAALAWLAGAGPRTGWVVPLAMLPVCLAAGVWHAWPPSAVTWRSRHPEFTIRMLVGDLFTQVDADLVIGFTDTFDTSVTGDRIIAGGSVQGQFLVREYGGDKARLDADLDLALAPVPVAAVEQRSAKRLGKLSRYPLGTVAVLGQPGRLRYLAAYSRMGNDLVPRSSVGGLWHSLAQLWDAVYEHGQRRPVAMPVVGSGLARIDQLGPEALAHLILLSFVARSRETPICRELRIVVHPSDAARFDLRALGRVIDSM